MKKLIPGILALMMCFGGLAGCDSLSNMLPDGLGNIIPGLGTESSTPATEDSSNKPDDSTPAQAHAAELANVRSLVFNELIEDNMAGTTSDNRSFTVPNTYNYEGKDYDVSWKVADADGNEVAGVSISEGEANDTVVISVDSEVNYVLTGTITCPDGCCSISHNFNRVAKAEPIPVAVTEAELQENVAYKFYVFQAAKNGGTDCYLTGGMVNTYYFGSTPDYATSIDLYIKKVDGGFNLYHVVDGENVYIHVVKSGNYTNAKYWTLEEIRKDAKDENATPTVWSFDSEWGTIATTLSGSKYYLGCDGTYDTVEPQYKTGDGYFTGYLCLLKDKSEVVITEKDKVDDTLASLSFAEKYTLDKENIILATAGSKYAEVAITWAAEGEGVVLEPGFISFIIPTEATTVKVTATATCGDYSDSKEFTIVLGPKSVEVADKTDIAAILAAANNLAVGETLPGFYTMTGTITSIDTPWDSQYSNITVSFKVNDDTTMKCYRLKNAEGVDAASALKVGDVITVYGQLMNHNGKVQFGQGCTLQAVEGGNAGGNTPVVPDEPSIDNSAVIPEAGKAYAFGMTQANVNNTIYYLAGGMDSYYMATTDNIDNAIATYIEATTGGFYFYTYVNGVKTYINMVVSGTHVNGAYEATASTVYTIDEANKTLIASVDGTDYWFGTRNDKTYTTMGPCAVSYAGFYAQFYLLENVEEPDAPVVPEEPEQPEEPDVPVATENKADFNTIPDAGYGQYSKTFTSANGWTTVNAALQVGGPSVANPAFPVVGADNTYKAVCLNGKTSAPGKLTSPTLTGGISSLSIIYTKMFTDTMLGAKIIVTNLATGATQETTFSRDVAKDDDKYVVWTFDWELDTAIVGDFTIEIVNTCPSALDSNKDRLTILELSWVSASNEGGDTPVDPEEPEQPEEPEVPEIETLTIAEAIELGKQQSSSTYTTEMYYATGKVVDIQNTTYGNIVISDGTNEILIYGLYLQNEDGSKGTRYDKMENKPLLGDTIKILSVVGNFNSTAQFKDSFLVEIVSKATDADKVSIENDALDLTDAVTGAASVNLIANGAIYSEVAIAWEVTAGNDIASIVDGKLEISNPNVQTTVTLKATFTCNQSIDSKTFDIVVNVLSAGEAVVTVADLNTLTVGTSYTTGKTTNGWSVTGAAVFQNGTANSGSSFAAIPAGEKAVCLNGKTSNVGKLTSPTLTTGVSKISFDYGYFFSESNGINITINVKNTSGAVVATQNVVIANSNITKLSGYSYEWVLESAVAEDCTVEVVNNSPSKNSSSNKDRLAIWNFAVTGIAS